MVFARSCGLTRVSQQIAVLTCDKESNVRQRLREWYVEKGAKAGKKRQELSVVDCFVPLLGWVLSWWTEAECRIALAMDASSLGMNFVVLSISVVYRGCAIPVAWKILQAAQPGAWKGEWLTLFALLKPAIPENWLVLVLADRGLYASWLFQAIQKQKWHPFLRINANGKFRAQGSSQFLPMTLSIRKNGQATAEMGTCFKTNPIQATLLTCWIEEQYADPWVIVTDLPMEQAKIAWYGMRTWIERGFRTFKRGGWQWQNTRMCDPTRATRFWLALSVATLWVMSVGGEADAHLPTCSLPELPENHIARRLHKKDRRRVRSVNPFLRGIAIIVAAIANHCPFPLGRFYPEPWPT
jgi:hypothetical protein